MVANALMLTIAIVLGLGFWFMQRLTYFISYKSVLFRFYGTPILIYCAVLFINVFALAFALNRKFFLKDTGRKLSHLDKQLHVADLTACAVLAGTGFAGYAALCWLFDISQVRGRVKDGLAVLRAKRANINIG